MIKNKLLLFLLFLSSIIMAQQASYNFTNGALTSPNGGSGATLIQNGSSLTTVDDRLQAPSNAISLNGDYLRRNKISRGNMSVSFWMKTSTNSTDKKIIIDQTKRSQSFDRSSQYGWYIYLKDGKVGVAGNFRMYQRVNGSLVLTSYNSDYSFISSTTNISDGDWHHIVVTTKGHGSYQFQSHITGYIYQVHVDGVLEGNQKDSRTAWSSSFNPTNVNVPFTIGRNTATVAGSSLIYSDVIDDLKVWNSTIPNSQVYNLAGVRKLTLTAAANGTVTTTPNAPQNIYNDGDNVVLTATPNTGNRCTTL